MKLGIIGSGGIVHECLSVVKEIKGIELQAICVRSSSLEKGEQLASVYGIPNIYTSYDACLEDKDIDCLYIGVINSLHYEYALKGLEQGKHIILEKPLVDTKEEALNLIQMAKEKKLFLWEAITNIHLSEYQQLKSKVQELGPLHMVLANYTQYSSRYDSYLEGEVLPAFDPELKGGALRDINIYNLHFIHGLLGEPVSSTYFPNLGFNGVDTSGTALLDYGTLKAIAIGAKDSKGKCSVQVEGENGFLIWNGSPNVPSRITGNIKGQDVEIEREEKHRMRDEFIAFLDMYEAGDFNRCYKYLEHSMGVMELLDGLTK